MKRVRVLRDAIDKGDPSPILVEIIDGGFVLAGVSCAEVELIGSVVMRYEPGAPLADGTRVWIECDDVRIRRRA